MTSLGNTGADAKRPVRAFGIESSAEQDRPFAHADQPVLSPAGPRLVIGKHGVGDGELNPRVAERKLDSGTARSVSGGVGERLLEDSIGGLIGGTAKRSPRARRIERHVESPRPMRPDQRAA